MDDNRTMEDLLQAPTEGYGEAIVIPDINADHFEIKTNLLQLVQANPYHGFERENPHTHINNFKRITSNLKFKDVSNDVIKLMMFPYSLEGNARVCNPGARMLTRAMAKQLSVSLAHECLFVYFVSEEEPKKVSKALKHPGWVDAMQDKLNQFTKNKAWALVPAPYGFNLKGYPDSNYVRCNMDRKSTSAEAGYVVVVRCCADILWMRSQLTDYDIIYEKVPIFCDNTSAIATQTIQFCIQEQSIFRYHFIKDYVLKWDLELQFIPTQYQLVDIFTKPLDKPTFKRLIVKLGMLNIDSKSEASALPEED
nr:retrovirus-related Pol polyprotein from transposon TNT 1-94 [Tanacetum cinerariifolium]